MIVLVLVLPGLARPPCPVPQGDHVYAMAIEAHGLSVAGLAAVSFGDDAFALVALSPAGIELFGVKRTGETTTVDAAFPEWKPWLERLPFERDLTLVATAVTHSCRADSGSVLLGEVRRWRGKGGPARASAVDDRWTVRDPLRGYTLTLREAG